MDSNEFRKCAKAVIDHIVDYMDNIRDRRVLPDVQPEYLIRALPEDAPERPENWKDLLKDFNDLILPGITHWQSPNFHAYYPTSQSWPSILGDILGNGLGVVGFNWIASPAFTELEVVTMNWLAKLLGLPETFLRSPNSSGGGVIQGSASEATFMALIIAKQKATKRKLAQSRSLDEATISTKLIAYTSNQANSSVEKAGILASITIRQLKVDENCRLRAYTLKQAITEDIEKGLIPCCLVATIGTTGTCAFDPVDELGPVCQKEGVWLHVDAAYAGVACICPEYQNLLAGIEYADSIVMNLHKWMLVNTECSAMWIKNTHDIVQAFNIQRIYLPDNEYNNLPDYRHWQIPLGRRFRSLKLWFVLRSYGAQGIRSHIRAHVALAKRFANLVRSDRRFEVVLKPVMGLVCFRLKGEDILSKKLLDKITERRNIYMVAATYHGQFIIRFVVCSRITEEKDIEYAWNEISYVTDLIGNGIKQNGWKVADKNQNNC